MIYGIFGDVAFEVGNTHEDSTPRAAKRQTLSRNRSLARRFCRVLSVRWGTRSSGSRAARRFCPAGPQNHGIFESQVAWFACGTPVLAPRSVKTRDNGGPEAPGGGRRQATGARIRKKHLRNIHLRLVLEVEIVAVAPPARAGEGRRQATGASTGKKHLRNRHLSMVLEVKVSAGVPPARAGGAAGKPRGREPGKSTSEIDT